VQNRSRRPFVGKITLKRERDKDKSDAARSRGTDRNVRNYEQARIDRATPIGFVAGQIDLQTILPPPCWQQTTAGAIASVTFALARTAPRGLSTIIQALD